jgi:hypothetical protein
MYFHNKMVIGPKHVADNLNKIVNNYSMDTIRMDLLELGWGYVDWIDLAQDREGWRALVNSVLNLQVP